MKKSIKFLKENFEEVVSLTLLAALAIGLVAMVVTFTFQQIEQGEAVETDCKVTYATTENHAVCETPEGEKLVIETENAIDLVGAEMTVKQYENDTVKVYNIFGFMVDSSDLTFMEYDLSNDNHLTDKELKVKNLLIELAEVEKDLK